MEGKDGIKAYYKDVCEAPEKNLCEPVAVTPCTRKADHLPPHVKQVLASVHDDVIKRSYGCSTTYPEALEGANVLDLGCGTGRDCFVLSSLVGPQGQVVGMDMLEEALDFARGHIQYHQEKCGYTSPNLTFIKGYMEKMEDAGFQENHFDVIVSNCVISLCKDKKRVLQEAIKTLKPYGEIYFSDMYRQGEPPKELMDDNKLWCEGLTGSMTFDQLHAMASAVGFTTPRLVRARAIPVLDEATKHKLGDVKYAAVTYRLFKKCPELTTPASTLTYRGGIQGAEEVFKFDHRLQFKKDDAISVDEETAAIFSHSRYAKYFALTSQADGGSKQSPSEVADPFTLL